MIFGMYLDGCSYNQIISALNEKGFTTRRGMPFGKNSLYEILKNERYIGNYIYIKNADKDSGGKPARRRKPSPENIIYVPGGLPAIISEEDFSKVRIKMEKRRHKAARFTAKQEYLLSGKISCGICGSPYAGNSRKPRPDHPLYISYKCTRRNGKMKCKNPEINRDVLEKAVINRLSGRVFDVAVLPELFEAYTKFASDKKGSIQNKLKALEKEGAAIERKIDNIVNIMADTSSAALQSKLIELETRKEIISFELSKALVDSAQATIDPEKVTEAFLKAKSLLESGTLTLRKTVVDRFIDRILVFSEHIEVTFTPLPSFEVQEKIDR